MLGIISVWSLSRTREENEEAHGRLLDVILRNGFAPEAASAPRGPCWKVRGMPLEELLGLAASLGERHVLYGPDGELRLYEVMSGRAP